MTTQSVLRGYRRYKRFDKGFHRGSGEPEEE